MEAIIEGVPAETRPGVYMAYYLREWHPYARAPETIEEFEEAYVEVKAVKSLSLEQVWWHMQGMNWSPYGEARELIRSKGLKHTSMSVGDVIKDPTGTYWRVEDLGFKQLPFFGVKKWMKRKWRRRAVFRRR